MPAELEAWLAQFAMVLARVGGALAFLPLPALRQAPAAFRVALAVAISAILAPAAAAPGAGRADLAKSFEAALWNLPIEAAMGIAAGVALGWLFEIFTLGMQLISVQAGYSYASTIDPATQADSGVLQVVAQLAAGLLFASLGSSGPRPAPFNSGPNTPCSPRSGRRPRWRSLSGWRCRLWVSCCCSIWRSPSWPGPSRNCS
jgi:flagellar biosynthesis protein FliR